MIQNVCVYCGASLGKNPAYQMAAQALGQAFANRKIGLVYGGGSSGLMGVIANAVLENGGYAIGVIPEALAIREVHHKHLSESYIVGTMHERKAMMAERADGFVTLPGGFGTYEEIFETITWAQLGIHSKPIVIFNIEGYFDPFLQIAEHGVKEGFIRPIDPDLVRVATRVEDVIPMLEAETSEEHWRPKWLNINQI